jgi:hypothetical protein
MEIVYFVLLLLALICFVLTAFGVQHSRVGLLALGLAFWVAVPLIHALRALD